MRAIAALEDARRAMPQVFGTPTITDGIGMGTEGMKYSLVSREVIADCIETCVNGQWMDGVLVVGGCDKNMPGGMMAIARMNVPAIYVYGGTIKPGQLEGPGPRHRQRRSRRSAQFTAGKHERGGLRRHRAQRAVPASARAAACTPPTRCRSSFEALGMSLLDSSHDGQRRDDEKARLAPRVGARAGRGGARSDLKPRDIITRKSIENAVALIMATGGSTNAVLHFLAIAHAAGVEWTHRRLRAHAPQGAGAVRPEAVGHATSRSTCTAPAACRRC